MRDHLEHFDMGMKSFKYINNLDPCSLKLIFPNIIADRKFQ